MTCVRCSQDIVAGEQFTYNSDREPVHHDLCEPSEEYASEQMRRLAAFLGMEDGRRSGGLIR